ncbi:MAG: RHS repeat-associated core domain-containing protein, partial [Cyclobacteriaceae bacterium]
PKNLYGFQGQEYQEELGWHQYKWRNADPALGRFFNVDPLAEKFYYNSTYAFSENKVIRHVELEGLEAADSFTGEITADNTNTPSSVSRHIGLPVVSEKENHENKAAAAVAGIAVLAADNITGIGAVDDILIPGLVIYALIHTIEASLASDDAKPVSIPLDIADTDTQEKDNPNVWYHFTDQKGFEGIMSALNKELKPNSKGKVYVSNAPMNSDEAFQNLFLDQPTHKGKGDYVIAFTLSKKQEARLYKEDTRDVFEFVHKGTLYPQTIVYSGPNITKQ